MHIDGDTKDGAEIILPNVQEEQPQEIEIQIGADGEGTVIETTEKKPAAEGDEGDLDKPKRKGRLQRRFDQYRAQVGTLTETNQRLMDELEDRRQKDGEKDRKIEQLDHAAFKNHAAHVRAQVDKVTKELSAAHEGGDKDAVAKATIDASKWGAELGRVEMWERNHPEPTGDGGDTQDTTRQTPTQTQTQPQGQRKFTPEFTAWMAENPWFVPGAKDQPNPDFDMEMHEFAVAHGKVLEARYKRGGKANLIGKQEYWDELTKGVEQEFPEEGEEEPKPTPRRGQAPAMKTEGSEIPLASRSQPTGAPAARPGKVKLTSDEIGLVHSNVDNGAYGLNLKTGKPYTYQEGYVRFAVAKQKDQEQQAQLQGQRRA